MIKKELNISNILTLSRAAAGPFVMFLIINSRMIPALALFFLAEITDFLDGYFARKFREKTRFGQVIDPIADKLLTGFAFIGILVKQEMTGWVYVLAAVALVYLAGYIIFVKKRLKPIFIGKVSVVLQALAAAALVVGYGSAVYLIVLAALATLAAWIVHLKKIMRR